MIGNLKIWLAALGMILAGASQGAEAARVQPVASFQWGRDFLNTNASPGIPGANLTGPLSFSGAEGVRFGTNGYNNRLDASGAWNFPDGGTINARGYCFADGSGEAPAALSAALDAVPTYGTLELGNATYGLNALLTKTKSNYRILGYGATIKMMATNFWALGLTGTNITLEGLTIDANWKAEYGLFCNTFGRGLKLKNVTIKNMYLDNSLDPSGVGGVVGVYLSRGWSDVTIEGCTITNLTFSTNGNVGRFCKGIFGSVATGVEADYGTQIKIVNNWFYDVLGDGLTEGDCISIQEVNLTPATKLQLNLAAIVEGNHFVNFTRRAVKGYADGWIIKGNWMHTWQANPQQYGAIAAYGARVSIEGNTIVGPFYRGIETASGGSLYATNVVISGNILESTVTPGQLSSGIVVDTGSTNVFIENNHIFGNCTNGIVVVGDTKNVRIFGNSVKAFKYGILVATNGVLATKPLNTRITRNLVEGPETGIYLSQADTVWIEGNRGTATSAFIDTSGGTTVKRWDNGDPPAIVSATLDFPSISAGASQELTVAVTGAATGDTVSLGLPAAPTASVIFTAYVSAADTVTVRASNPTVGAIDPASASYRVRVFKD